MKKLIQIASGIFCFFLLSFANKTQQQNHISFTIKGQQLDFHYSGKATITSYKGQETLMLEAYLEDDKNSPLIRIGITSETNKHLVAGNYNYGDKEDFYGTYPLEVYYYAAKNDVYSTDNNTLMECTISSISKTKVKGTFKGRLLDELMSSKEITSGSFDFTLN